MKKSLPGLLIVLGVLATLLVMATPRSNRLIAQLGAPSAAERDRAAQQLLALGDDAVPGLRKATGSSDPAIRERAAAILDLLTRGTGPGSPARRREARVGVREALRTEGALTPGCDHDERLARLWPEAGNLLARAALERGEHRLVTAPLAAALARHATPDSILALADLAAADKLTPSAGLRAARQLEATLGTQEGRSRIGDARSIASDRIEPALGRGSAPHRRAVTALYGALASTRTAKQLGKLALDLDWAVRLEASRALGRSREEGTVEPLLVLLDDPAPAVRSAALDALGRREPDAARPHVARITNDASPQVRASAARFLAAHGWLDDRAHLERLLADESARVRAAARRGLVDYEASAE